MEHIRILELFENGEKDKNSCDSSILKNDEYELRSIVEFSNDKLLPTCHIFDDLITTINFSHPKILDCGIKSKKCVKIKRKKNFTSLILLTFDNLKLKMKRVLQFDRRTAFCKN